MKSLKKYLVDQGAYSKERLDEIASVTMFVLYRKPEPPKLNNVKAKSYLLGIAKKIFKKSFSKNNREISVDNDYLDSLPSVDDVFENMDIAERKKSLNSVISRMSPKCRELLEKLYSGKSPDEICKEMNYASKSVYSKKKSICKDKLKMMVLECPICREYLND
jgi:DNA-directed RNA polymerase specialized sigma24 family protein